MKKSKLITSFSLALLLSFGTVIPAFAESNTPEPNQYSLPSSNDESSDLAMEIAEKGEVQDFTEIKSGAENPSFEGIEIGIKPFKADQGGGGGGWDGSYTSDYTIPSWATAGGIAAITTWAAAHTAWNPYAVSIISAMAADYFAKDVRVKSTVYYYWVTKYTKVHYKATSALYADGKYKSTKTYEWTGSIDSNID